jgi:hypothetical protein
LLKYQKKNPTSKKKMAASSNDKFVATVQSFDLMRQQGESLETFAPLLYRKSGIYIISGVDGIRKPSSDQEYIMVKIGLSKYDTDRKHTSSEGLITRLDSYLLCYTGFFLYAIINFDFQDTPLVEKAIIQFLTRKIKGKPVDPLYEPKHGHETEVFLLSKMKLQTFLQFLQGLSQIVVGKENQDQVRIPIQHDADHTMIVQNVHEAPFITKGKKPKNHTQTYKTYEPLSPYSTNQFQSYSRNVPPSTVKKPWEDTKTNIFNEEDVINEEEDDTMSFQQSLKSSSSSSSVSAPPNKKRKIQNNNEVMVPTMLVFPQEEEEEE